MNRRRVALIAFFGLIAILITGCNLPTSPTPTPFVFPTPNLTMTAIFNQPVSIPPTVTPPGQQPTAIQPQATATTAPINTSTPILSSATPIRPLATSTATALPRVSSIGTFLSPAPTIDGPWDEWKTTQYPIKNVTFGAKNWTGSADLEAAYRVGWDNNNLYLAVKVTDDKYVQNATGADIYKGDSIELLFDSNYAGDAGDDSLSGDDYQIGVSPGKGAIGQNMEAYLWFPQSKAGSITSKVKIGAASMSDGYRIEASIPWSVLGVSPANGQTFGFAVSVSDNDNATENVQQTLISSAPDRVLTDPTTWGLMTLKK